ncbi:hypothetical protein MWU65_13230 [Cellulophaga sp. F20128]|uniref:hypothetical protein n=1 Tax=Cellulophaga sp. F20128 TaxID=2926413 RepID=UPI001FF4453B|nr:hypothetical protein [Cellulophaga sp. F20128]MCK0158150.1 hypothetical protein [Cellulophaga sp. F20128]
MKNTTLKILGLLLIVLFATSCVFDLQKKEQSQHLEAMDFTKEDILGTWVPTPHNKATINDTTAVKAITFYKNLTAAISLADTAGSKEVMGQWKIKDTTLLGSESVHVTFASDLVLNFRSDPNHQHIYLMAVGALNGKMAVQFSGNTLQKKMK